jgi:ABC-2 type transport system permease protein
MERPLFSRLHKYFALVTLTMAQSIKNYKMLFGLSLLMVTCMVIFSHIWQFAAARSGSVLYNSDQLLWYIAFNEWVVIALPGIHLEMEQDLRSGRLAYFLPRPISYVGSKFAEGTGALLLNLAVLGPIAFLLTWMWTDHIPLSGFDFAIAILLGLLAGMLGMIFQMLVGLSAFWLQEVGPFHWLWEKFLFVFGGLILPLSAYPQWLEQIAVWTPFSVVLGARSALVIDPSTSHFLWVGSMLLLWIAIATVCLQILYRKGLRILNIQGG